MSMPICGRKKKKKTIDAKAFRLASIVVGLEVCISKSYARI